MCKKRCVNSAKHVGKMRTQSAISQCTITLRFVCDKKLGENHATFLHISNDFICSNFSVIRIAQMRDLVTRRSYRLRKKIDDFLFWLLPNAWIPLYNSVSFSHMPYKKCIENRKWQDTVNSIDQCLTELQLIRH